MFDQPLFLDKALDFGQEKLAGMLTRLGDNSDMWPQEIVQEAHKQLPYLGDFEANVVLDKVDEERGFAFGSVEVRPKSSMTPEEERATSPLKKVHIPVVVKEQMMSPFDIFMIGRKFQHLTESRLRSALLRPDVFDTPRRKPFDISLIQDLQPPYRDGWGSGIKLGSAVIERLPILPQLNGRILLDHQERITKLAEVDPSFYAQLRNAPEGVKAAFASAFQLAPTSPTKTAEYIADNMKATVVQIQGQANGKALVKWANADMYAPQAAEVPMDVAQDLYGAQDVRPMLEGDGSITASPDATVKKTLELEEVSNANQFGLWQVQDLQGNELIGWVFPSLLSLDLQPLPLALFSNGSQYAVQDQIAGKVAGKSTDIPKGIPKGYGCLYYIDHGTAKAFVPMTITSSARGPDGMVKYIGSLETGEEATFSFIDGLKTVARVGQAEYMVPSTMNWMPLRGRTELVTQASMFAKVASRQWVGEVDIVGDHGVFSFRGAPIAKIASDQTKFICQRDAEFLAVALGMEESFAKEALAKASRGELVKVSGLRTLTPPSEKMAAARAQVVKDLAELDPPIRNFFLAKEAAWLDDALTADRILGLGFVNAENVATFVDMLPGLEATSSLLSELLLAVRLGMKDIPEAAVERMLAALEDVIRGLRTLQQKEVTFAG